MEGLKMEGTMKHAMINDKYFQLVVKCKSSDCDGARKEMVGLSDHLVSLGVDLISRMPFTGIGKSVTVLNTDQKLSLFIACANLIFDKEKYHSPFKELARKDSKPIYETHHGRNSAFSSYAAEMTDQMIWAFENMCIQIDKNEAHK